MLVWGEGTKREGEPGDLGLGLDSACSHSATVPHKLTLKSARTHTHTHTHRELRPSLIYCL